jgi:glycosyltransferase involved in cell wall biosynthesis
VALEGAACGCIVIGSDQGGLPDAIGPCGFTFPNGNATALAECIAKVLHDEYPPKNDTARKFHLERHQPRVVIDRYLSLFDGLH